MTLPLPLTAADSLFSRIGEERLRRLLWLFYSRVMQDPLLAPVFRSRLGDFPGDHWPAHLLKIEQFWRAVTHGESTYRGQPGPAHRPLDIGAAHFDRWLTLWEQTLSEVLPPAEALALLTMAQRMRVNLERFTEPKASATGADTKV